MVYIGGGYNSKPDKTLEDMIEFHVRFERIHPFQDEKNSIGQINIMSKMLSKMKVKSLTFFNFKFY